MHLVEMILPILAIVAAGWLARTTGYLPRELAPLLTRFAYCIAMPALVFLTIGDESLRSLLDVRFIVAFGGGSMVSFAAAMAIARLWRGASLGSSAMIGATVAMTNTAFIALPILKTLYGRPGVLAAAIATIFIGVVMVPMMVVLLEIARSAGSRTIRLWPLLRPIVTNPLVLSTILGLAWSVSGMGMPQPLDTFLSFYALLTLAKLLLVPLVVYLLCLAIGLDRNAMVAAVVCAAVPTGKSVYILAVEYDTEKTMVGAVISLSTLLSIVTMIGWLAVARA
jgi:malonate transporter